MGGKVRGFSRLSVIFLFFLILTPVFADQSGIDFPHNSMNGINCSKCHANPYSPPIGDHVPPEFVGTIDDTTWNNVCWSCHGETSPLPYTKTHSSLTTSDKYGPWSIECKTCHWPHHQMQMRAYGPESFVHTATIDSVTATSITKSGGTPWQENEYAGYIVIPNLNSINGVTYDSSIYDSSYNYRIINNTADTLTVQGTIDLAFVTPGNTMAIIYGNLIKDTIVTPNSGIKTAKLFENSGPNSFADDETDSGIDPTPEGICQVCHTLTDHWLNNGTVSATGSHTAYPHLLTSSIAASVPVLPPASSQ